MIFNNSLYFIDSNMIAKNNELSVYGIISICSNPTYLQLLSKQVIENLNLVNIDKENFAIWIKEEEHIMTVINMLSLLKNNKKQISISSYFTDRLYCKFIYFFNLAILNQITYNENIITDIEKLYKGCRKDLLINLDNKASINQLEEFNSYIKQNINCKDYSYIKNIISNDYRSITEQLQLLNNERKVVATDFSIVDYIHFTSRLCEIYNKTNIESIYAYEHAKDLLSTLSKTGILSNSNIIQLVKNNITLFNNNEPANILFRFLIILSDYIFSKLTEAKSINDFSEYDKYIFISVWNLFQSGDCNMIFNKHVYSTIKDLFASIKKELNADNI